MTPNRAATQQLPNRKTFQITPWPLTRGWRKQSHPEATPRTGTHMALPITLQRSSLRWPWARMRRSITTHKCWRLSRDNVKRVRKLPSSQGTPKKGKGMLAPSLGILTFFNRWHIPRSIWPCLKPSFRSHSKARFWTI